MRGQPLETFVDRIAELALLRALVDEAARGEPRVALVVGDSGLGKTSLARKLARAAQDDGATVLHATCQEGLNVPYLPMATALRALDVVDPPLGASPPPSLFDDASASSASDASASPTASSGAQLHLFVAATDAIRTACHRAPVVLIVDDVQWADPASVELLSHLSASLLLSGAGARHSLLLVLAHRPWAEPPVARLLDRLRRHPAASEIGLRPFESAEGNALISAVAGVKARPDTLARLLEHSGGNPLLLRGLLDRNLADRHLVIDGRQLVIADRAAVAGGRRDLDLDAEDRIARLSERCRAAAGMAAFIAAEGRVEVLAAAHETDVDDALAEAEAAGILLVDGDRYRFELDAVRRHLRDRTAARQAGALHRRVADAVEQVLGDAAPPSVMLGHLLGAEPVDPDRVRAWARRAGDVAYTAGAWRDALDAYDRVVESAPADVEPAELALIRLRAGIAGFWANDIDACRSHLDAAIAVARSIDDLETWAEAVLTKGRAAFVGASVAGDEPQLGALLEATRHQPALHARALATAADLAYARFDFDRGIELAQAAVDVERVGGRATSALPAFSLGALELATFRLTDAAHHFADAERIATALGDDHLRTVARSRQLLLHLVRGELSQIEELGPGLVAEMQRLGFWPDVQVAMCSEIGAALLDGRFADAEQSGGFTELLLDWVPYSFTAGMLLPAQAAGRCLRGDIAGARHALERWAQLGGRGPWRYQQLVDVLDGNLDGVRRQLERRPWPAPPANADLFAATVLAAQVEVGAAVGDPDMVERAMGPLGRALEDGVLFTVGWPASLHRVVGIGQRACGRTSDAIAWFELGLEELDRTGARVEVARTELALAELEVAAGVGGADRRAADVADALDDLGLLPMAAAARRLASRGRRASPPRRRVVFCSDLVGSTELNLRAGDERYVALLQEHDRILRHQLRAHDGVEFKHTGDGMFAWFTDADDAVECALDFQDDLERWGVSQPELPLVARVGLAMGDPVDTGDDLFGLTVVLASRLCGVAGSSGVAVAEEVVSASSSARFSFLSTGRRRLKGFRTDIAVWEVLRLPVG